MEERKLFVGKLIEENMPREGIRRELISHGISTDGFEAEYAELLQQAGKNEPAPEKPIAPPHMQEPSGATVPENVPLPGIGAMLGFGINVTKKKWKAITILAVISILPTLLFLLVPAPAALLGVLLAFAAAFVSFLATTAILYIVIQHEESIRSTDALQWAFRHFFPIVWISILSTLITAAGLILFIIPALIFGIYNVFSFIAFVREDARGTRALLRSTDLVRGAFWGILGRIILLTLVFFVIGIGMGIVLSFFEEVPVLAEAIYVATTLLQMVLTAIGLGAFVTLYEARRKAKPLFDLTTYGALAWIYRLGSLLGVVLTIIVSFAVGTYLSTFISQIQQDELLQWQEGTWEEDPEGLNFSDFLMQQKVAATAASANMYGGRMGSYEGVCSDITIVDPIQCAETPETFAIFAPLSDGQYYCSDSTSFTGTITGPLRDTVLCQ